MKIQMTGSNDLSAWRKGGPKEYVRDPQGLVYFPTSLRYTLAISGLLALLAIAGAAPLRAQQEDHRKKVPVLDKITTAPNGQNEFNGKVQSLDLKNEVLNVESLHQDDTEIFPIKKTVTVASANGYRVDIGTLKPGTNILVYFEQRGDKRKVKEIVVLGSAPAAAATKAAATPPS